VKTVYLTVEDVQSSPRRAWLRRLHAEIEKLSVALMGRVLRAVPFPTNSAPLTRSRRSTANREVIEREINDPEADGVIANLWISKATVLQSHQAATALDALFRA
jgi:hypothetical protein